MNLVFLLEELSAKEMLEGLLPKVLPDDVVPYFIVFEGKSDLEKRIPIKIRGWKLPDSRFVVLRDKDSGDCLSIKRHLQELSVSAGRLDTLVRIACHEVESWYLGDLKAVENALDLRLPGAQSAAKYRDPDRLANAAQELERITNGKYQKVAGSRAIGPLLDITRNRSTSFHHFISRVERILREK